MRPYLGHCQTNGVKSKNTFVCDLSASYYLAVNIVLGTFSVKLQSEKTNTYERRLQLYDHIEYSPKLAVFIICFVDTN